MKPEYRLLDNFTVIAYRLCAADADTDIAEVRASNKQRNAIHSDALDEAALRVEQNPSGAAPQLFRYGVPRAEVDTPRVDKPGAVR